MLAMLLASGPWKPEWWLEKAGGSAFFVITAIIFAESGLFFGFFLPGDSLLFLAGFLTSTGAHEFVAPGESGEALAPVVAGFPDLWVMLPVFFLAAVLGDQVGYVFGQRVGPSMFTREDSRLFRQSHVTKAHDFLEKHGPKTILLARFVPIVRTFAPIVAGVGAMRYRTFLTYNLIGAFFWAVGVTTLGHFLGNIGFVRDNIEIAILGVVALSLMPVAYEMNKSRRHKAAAAAAAAAGAGAPAAGHEPSIEA
jgi:membrane-associated protein